MYRENKFFVLDTEKCCDFIDCATGLNKKVTSHGRFFIHKTLTTASSERLTTGLVSYILPVEC